MGQRLEAFSGLSLTALTSEQTELLLDLVRQITPELLDRYTAHRLQDQFCRFLGDMVLEAKVIAPKQVINSPLPLDPAEALSAMILQIEPRLKNKLAFAKLSAYAERFLSHLFTASGLAVNHQTKKSS